LHYQADGQQIAPLERAMRLSEDVLRYLTLKIDALPNTGEEAEAAEAEATPVEA
jgi:small subunit ribosomal protein S6